MEYRRFEACRAMSVWALSAKGYVLWVRGLLGYEHGACILERRCVHDSAYYIGKDREVSSSQYILWLLQLVSRHSLVGDGLIQPFHTLCLFSQSRSSIAYLRMLVFITFSEVPSSISVVFESAHSVYLIQTWRSYVLRDANGAGKRISRFPPCQK